MGGFCCSLSAPRIPHNLGIKFFLAVQQWTYPNSLSSRMRTIFDDLQERERCRERYGQRGRKREREEEKNEISIQDGGFFFVYKMINIDDGNAMTTYLDKYKK